MSGSNGAPRRCRVDRAAHVLDQVQRLFRDAEDRGQAEPFVTAMRRVMADLRARAREVGEPLWTLPHAQLEVRLIAVHPVSVRFAVHQTAFEVVILQVDLMSPRG